MKALFFTCFALIFLLVPQSQAKDSAYTLSEIDYIKNYPVPPTLPDISGHTPKNLLSKIPAVTDSEIVVEPLHKIVGFTRFMKGQFWDDIKKFQNKESPLAIVIMDGVADLDDIVLKVNDKNIIEKVENHSDYDYIVRKPIYVSESATLILRGENGQTPRIALSSKNGVFIMSAGKTFAVDVDVFSWNLKKKDYDKYKDKKIFRAFWLSIGSSETYFLNSIFRHMGFANQKSYGIAFSTDKQYDGNPTGWILNSKFDGMFYGYYSYEAMDMVLLNNEYKDNIYYGIDPHDRSERLIIGYNKTYGTKERHGIIISREVNDSFIFNNDSFGNKGSGIMLDRSSKNNLVYNNSTYRNGAYGIALFESQDNILKDNIVSFNDEEGIKIRNSWDVKLFENIIYGNGGTGVEITDKDIGKRDKIDAYTMKASAEIYGGTIYKNVEGGVRFISMDSVSLYKTSLHDNGKADILGDVGFGEVRKLKSYLALEKGGIFERQ